MVISAAFISGVCSLKRQGVFPLTLGCRGLALNLPVSMYAPGWRSRPRFMQNGSNPGHRASDSKVNTLRYQ